MIETLEIFFARQFDVRISTFVTIDGIKLIPPLPGENAKAGSDERGQMTERPSDDNKRC